MDDIGERLNKQILLVVLEGDVSARQIVNIDILTYVESTLTQEDWEACKYYMNGQLIELMAMFSDNVKVARQAVPDLLKMLRNIEPNAGGGHKDNPGHHKVDWSMIPKLERYKGDIKSGYGFIQSFKSMM